MIIISGGTDRIPYQLGVLKQLQNTKHDDIIGTSSGALAGLAFVTGNLDKAIRLGLSLTNYHIFGYEIYSKKGKWKAVKNIIKGEKALWNYDKLRDTLKDVISKESFEAYKRSDHTPTLWVNGVNLNKSKEEYINVKKLTYYQAIEAVVLSSTIPLISRPVKFKGFNFIDGAMGSYIGTEFGYNLAKEGDVVYEVHSRVLDTPIRQLPKKGSGYVFFKYLFYIVGVILDIIGDKNVSDGDKIALRKNIKQKKYAPDTDLLNGFFVANIEDNHRMYNLGLIANTHLI